ncbi:MAG: hypothetical protein ACOYMN_16495 [Roseimicrobium sp.]
MKTSTNSPHQYTLPAATRCSLAISFAITALLLSAPTPARCQDFPRRENARRAENLAEETRALEESMNKIGDALMHASSARSGNFNWAVCNELRHFYSGRDESKSFHFCNVILQNSVMDGYILNIVSGWATAPALRCKNLERVAVKYPQFPCLVAACLLDAAEKSIDGPTRRSLYERVGKLGGPGIEAYRAIAKACLEHRAEPTPATAWK